VKQVRKILRISCQVAGTACLGLGFALTGQWAFVAAALVVFTSGMLDLRWPSGWLPPVALAVGIGLAATGVFTGAATALMLLAAILAMFSWDLILLDHTLASNPPNEPTTRLERRHYQNLASVAGIGLLAVLASQGVQVQIPFVVMVALVGLVLYFLLRLVRMLSE
jgi:hypothetical protein